ncbi:hypothetical protein BpJC7_30800 [Weizmannia acidilactici]|mgnify:CR=1 FL=1|uniref:Thiamine-binding protein domain-containing protein n=1 Tax=Weizmannia acidilactici TaxID=2607726 RepID=A0A5J4JN18_9BACI|nr:MTH1187 family thiamine-binding protein [Weizmannia acidilactici]GER66789.1 hypothetical protein BpJC4_12600 [Weizmannia acidilactici]GER71777.1 hypothetical protein BpJC7_30800 [Weizmannia acidilactici]GER74331.1 hypothetical protein BpPP18_23980 [Weizmannia acidilactici]
MAIADITIFPMGTESTSVSRYIAEIEKVLKKERNRVKIQLTPMSTLIEGDIHDLFEIIEKLHEVPFKHGIMRVETNIRIDDRRDKPLTMEGKLASVAEKMGK